MGGGREGGGGGARAAEPGPLFTLPRASPLGEVQITEKSPVRSPEGRRLKLGHTLNPETEGHIDVIV